MAADGAHRIETDDRVTVEVFDERAVRGSSGPVEAYKFEFVTVLENGWVQCLNRYELRDGEWLKHDSLEYFPPERVNRISAGDLP